MNMLGYGQIERSWLRATILRWIILGVRLLWGSVQGSVEGGVLGGGVFGLPVFCFIVPT